MRHTLIPLAVAVLLLAGFGCAKTPETTNTNTNTPNIETPTASTTTPDVAPTTTPTTAPQTGTPPKPTTSAARKTFYVEMDDKGAYPASGTAAKNTTVTVTFKMRSTNVFYNGLVVKSNKYDLGKIQGGQSKTITFKATEDITFVGQWPNGASKARWTLIVK